MEIGAMFLLLFAILGIASSQSFYGDSISFMPLRKQKDGTFKVTFHHRLNGRGDCSNQSSYACEGGVCTSFNKSSALLTDQDSKGQGKWCQSEGQTTAIVLTNKTSLSLRDSGCCWTSNVNGKTNWTSHAQLDLGTRSDSRAINSCPITTTVSSLRVPQNCFTRHRLLAHDADGDIVRCRFSADATVPSNLTLHETECILTGTGQLDIGVHVFELMLEDFPTKNITLTYADGTSGFRQASDMNTSSLCKLELQFSIEILPSIPSCEAGHVQPMFLSATPSHGDVLYATVGQQFQLYAQAQAHHSSIYDFQVSGPQEMTKEFTDDVLGKAEVTLSWTPKQSDIYRFVPVCFTAETNETQSEMRCAVIMVTPASISQGKATVECSPNKMVVALEKASMPGIDENYLKLKDPSCSLTSNSTHIMASMSFSTCGTILEDKGDFLAFENEINSFELPTEIIIRRKTVRIDFSCKFPKSISISSYFNVHQSDYIFTESSIGSFGYTFEIFTDSNFTTKVKASAYPVEVMLLQTIYMGIQAQSDLPNVTLFVESCKATPDENPENTLSYDLIKNGCLKDETLKSYQANQTAFNFEVQAFKFTGNFEQVYITCSVILCEPGNMFSRCAQGCLNDSARRRRRRRRRDLGMRETVSHYITQGPLQFVRQAVPKSQLADNNVVMKNSLPEVIPPPVSPYLKSSDGSWGIKEVLNTHISTVVLATAFLASLVLLAGVYLHFFRKQKAEDCKFLLDSDPMN